MRDFTAHYCTLLHIAFANIAHFGDFSTLPNVVGYAQSPLCNGASLVAPQFLNIAGETFSLDNFSPIGDGCYGNVSINRLDANGYITTTYIWTDCGGEGWDTPDVWVDDSNNIVEGVDFAFGDALWVVGSSESQGLQSAGEVSVKDSKVQLKGGATLVGNAFPVSLDINDIVPTGDGCYGNISISKLDEYGYFTETYSWTDCGGDGWDTPNVWVDANNSIADGVVFAPGEGFWVTATSDAQFLNIPAPEL